MITIVTTKGGMKMSTNDLMYNLYEGSLAEYLNMTPQVFQEHFNKIPANILAKHAVAYKAYEEFVNEVKNLQNTDTTCKIYHATTPAKVKKYRETGHICKPVRGFDNQLAAMAWASKVARTVILEVEVEYSKLHKLPDHHNVYGDAYWYDDNANTFKCVFSADGDA